MKDPESASKKLNSELDDYWAKPDAVAQNEENANENEKAVKNTEDNTNTTESTK